jgi:outer membrane protein
MPSIKTMARTGALALLTSAWLAFPAVAFAESKVGFVNSQKIMNESPQATRAKKRIEKEFEKRDQDLQKLAKQLQSMQESTEKNALTMSESERRTKEREFGEQNREFQRKQREFREDLSQRQNDEMATILERVNKTIKQIAEAEKYDIVFQEAVWASPRIDITDKVLKALADGK